MFSAIQQFLESCFSWLLPLTGRRIGPVANAKGSRGDDTIRSWGRIYGGKGNDQITIDRTRTSDTLIFNLGDGKDIVTSYDPSASDGFVDAISFGKGITEDMISFSRIEDNLVIIVGDGGDQITFTDYFKGEDYQTFSRIEFYDRSVIKDFRSMLTNITGDGDKDSIIEGTPFDDHIIAGSGNDIINDPYGNNYIDAGAGNDVITAAGTIIGGRGNDQITVVHSDQTEFSTLIFNLGDGQDVITSNDTREGKDLLDTIVFGAGITKDMIAFAKVDNHLVIKIGENGDQMTFINYYSSTHYQTFNKIKFHDGTEIADIRVEVFTMHYDDQGHIINGTNFDDKIFSGSGNDNITDVVGQNYIDAGGGDDVIHAKGTIKGGEGNDDIYFVQNLKENVLEFNLGDGQDIVNNTVNLKDPEYVASGQSNIETKDTIKFGADINASMLSYERSYNDLVIVVGNDGDQITFKNYFYKQGDYSSQTFNRIEFADGAVIDNIRQLSDIINLAKPGELVPFHTPSDSASSSLYQNQTDSLVSAMSTFVVDSSSSSWLVDNQTRHQDMFIATEVA